MRRAFSRLAFALLALVVLARAAAAQNGRIQGVVEDEDGRPIKAASITAEFPDAGLTMTAATDDKGRFSMLGLRSGRWNFMAQAPGFAPRSGSVAVRAASPNVPLAFALLRRGEFTGPLGSLNSKVLQTQLAQADGLFDQEHWDEAIAIYRDLVAKTPALVPIVNSQMAAAYRNKHDDAAALAVYEEMLKRDPSSEQAVLGISAVAMDRGDAQTAEDVLTKAALAPAPKRGVLYGLAEVKMARGDAGGAATWFRKAADADPAWGKPLYQLGVAALNGGDRPVATTLLGQVIAVDPESTEAALARTTLERLGR